MTLVFLAALALGEPSLAQPSAPGEAPPPLVKPDRVQKVSDHVWVIPDDSVPLVSNIGFVVGSRATLVVDTGLGRRNGEAILGQAIKLAPRNALYIVTTHIHPEHDLGAQAFPSSATLIRSKDQVAEIAEQGLTLAQAFARRSALTAELLKDAQFRKADLVFEREHDLDLGGVKVRILAMGPNHTKGDTATFVEGERVLFSGDVAMRPQPAFASPASSLSHWLQSLDRLDALKPAIVVPSHGPMGDAAIIAGYRTYLTTIQARTRELKAQGKSAEEAGTTITSELAVRYPDRGRLAGAIRAAWAEAK